MLPIQQSIDICNRDASFEEYIAREKTLAFVFTLLQQIDKNKDNCPVFRLSNFQFLNSEELKEDKQISKTFFLTS